MERRLTCTDHSPHGRSKAGSWHGCKGRIYQPRCHTAPIPDDQRRRMDGNIEARLGGVRRLSPVEKRPGKAPHTRRQALQFQGWRGSLEVLKNRRPTPHQHHCEEEEGHPRTGKFETGSILLAGRRRKTLSHDEDKRAAPKDIRKQQFFHEKAREVIGGQNAPLKRGPAPEPPRLTTAKKKNGGNDEEPKTPATGIRDFIIMPVGKRLRHEQSRAS